MDIKPGLIPSIRPPGPHAPLPLAAGCSLWVFVDRVLGYTRVVISAARGKETSKERMRQSHILNRQP